MKVNIGICISVLYTLCAASQSSIPWTKCYQKKIDAREYKNNAVVFEKIDVIPFSQLIFSWNAFRPTQGYLTFFVQTRNTDTQRWGEWHMMADWGHNIQKSYGDKHTHSPTEFVHVRLEHKHHQTSDGFRVKAVGYDGAPIEMIKRMAVCIARLNELQAETPDMFKHLTSVEIANVPELYQMVINHERANHMCSPTSCTMLLRFLLNQPFDPETVAAQVYDTGLQVYGSWPFNTAYAFDAGKGAYWFSVVRLASFAMLHELLRHNMPVIVSVRGKLDGAPKEYSNGHLLVVIGYDAHTHEVICNDPAVDVVHTRYQLVDFLRAWERSHRLSYVAQRAA